jgi:predicted HicB family RNase H-like nuclease
MPKQRKRAGRPKLPQGDAKAVMLRVRITPDEHKAIEAKAKTGRVSVSQWIRSTLAAAVEG